MSGGGVRCGREVMEMRDGWGLDWRRAPAPAPIPAILVRARF